MRQRKLAVFDIDGTLFRSGLYREVAYEMMKMGVLPKEVLEETTAKNREWRHRTHGNAFEDFDMLVCDMVDRELPHIRIDDYEEAAGIVLAKRAENIYVYTKNLIKDLKEQGYYLIAISGSQVELVGPFAQKYGFDTWVGQQWERGTEYFTGNIVKTHTNKDVIIRDLMGKYNLTLKDSVGVGDSNGDAGMLAMVDHPIAFNPTQELFEKAAENGWTIILERKNMIYTLQQSDESETYELTAAKHH